MKQLSTAFSMVLHCLGAILPAVSHAQSEPCGFKTAMQAALQHNPAYAGLINQMEQNPKYGPVPADGIYRIPTVVHIIHKDGPENITDAQVHNAIAQANFQLAGGEGGFDTKIQLILARVDPQGNCTTGIVRVNSLAPDVCPVDFEADIAFKSQSRWPPDRYLNIWIVREICNSSTTAILGYAYFPWETPTLADGIVIAHRYFGTIGTAVGNVANTLAHEFGHYAALYHVWGDDFSVGQSFCSNCHQAEACWALGDRVCDTAPCCRALEDLNCGLDENLCGPIACACLNPNTGTFYPKDNYMSYNYSCQYRFTEGQAQRMYNFALNNARSYLWSEENLRCAGISHYYATDVVVHNPATPLHWTTANLPHGGKIFIQGNLTIESGCVLRVGSGVEVRFCRNGKLIVKPNARLELEGKLSSVCGAAVWKGVEVWGNSPSQSQYAMGGVRAQGLIECYPNSVIENAEAGIQLYGPDPAYAGGQLSCNGATIRNCRIGVKFAPYQNFWPTSGQPRPYAASFTGVAFITNNEYPHEDPFESFVHMTGVNGISLTGCSFTNTRSTTSDDIAAWGYGIFANDAGFSVRSLCTDNPPTPWPGPCEEYVHSTFSGLGYGIYAARIGEGRPYTVRQANFEKCFVGIRNKGVAGGTILFNHFNLGELPSTTPTGDHVGIIFQNETAGFICEENHFIGGSGNATATIGTLCINTGMANKTIRQNRFVGLSIGNLSNLGNASQSPQDGIRRLYYDCNRNFDVLEKDFSVPNGRIKAKQGLEIPDPINPGQVVYGAAGNRFSHTAVDFSNFGNPIEYFFNPLGQNQQPLAIEGNIQLVEAVQNPCPVTYCEPPCRTKEEIALIKSDYYLQKEAYLAAKASYAANPTDESARKMAYRQRMMDEDAYMVVIHELYDTLSFNADTLRTWVANLGSLEGDLWLAGERLGAGNAPAALSLLDAAVSKYQLTGEAQADIGNYQSMVSLLAGKNMYDLDAATLHSVTGYLDAKGYSAGWAKSILTLYGGHFPAEYVKYGDLIEERSAGEERPTPAGWLPEWIRASPNPAGAHVDFSISLPENTKDIALLISDINGRQVLHQHGLAPTGTFVWHTNSLSSGLYFYHLIAEGRVLKSGKIVLSK